MVTPAAKREAVAHLRDAHETSERRACNLIGCDRMTVRYRSRRPDDPRLRERLRALARERRRFDYRRLLIFLGGEGFVVNHKRLFRIYREEQLMVRKRGGRKRAIGSRTPMAAPALPNDRWSLDFVSDQMVDGRRFRILAILLRAMRLPRRVVVGNPLAAHPDAETRLHVPCNFGRPVAGREPADHILPLRVVEPDLPSPPPGRLCGRAIAGLRPGGGIVHLSLLQGHAEIAIVATKGVRAPSALHRDRDFRLCGRMLEASAPPRAGRETDFARKLRAAFSLRRASHENAGWLSPTGNPSHSGFSAIIFVLATVYCRNHHGNLRDFIGIIRQRGLLRQTRRAHDGAVHH